GLNEPRHRLWREATGRPRGPPMLCGSETRKFCAGHKSRGRRDADPAHGGIRRPEADSGAYGNALLISREPTTVLVSRPTRRSREQRIVLYCMPCTLTAAT